MAQNGGKKDDSNIADVAKVQDAGGQNGDGALDDGETIKDEIPPAGEDPVRRAERELQMAQDQLADAKDKAKRDDEIARALGQYEVVQVDLEADEAALIEHHRVEMEKLGPTDEEMNRVGKEADDLSRPADDLRASLAQQKAALNAKKANLADLKAEREDAKEAFERRKNQIKGIQDRHRAAGAIHKEAADARTKQKRLLAFYLLKYRLAPATQSDPQPIEFAAYRETINAQSAAFGSLNRTVADLESTIKGDEKKIADDEKRLADLEKGFEATIRARLTALS